MVFIVPNSFASDYDRTYSSNVQFGQDNHKLYISVAPSLYNYYHGKTHSVRYDDDYSKFVTPDAVRSIAENIRNITRDKLRSDEEFANAVLMLVHQLPYVIGDMKYPIETLVDNSGKCDTLSLLAASIMKAGGLDVVLLYYKELHHMNVGVYLPDEPYRTVWWVTPTYYECNGKKYWMAECTPATNWKVGDRPDLLAGAKPLIISLENCETSSPACVSSSLDIPLIPSSISINLSSEDLNVGGGERALTISGSISPDYPGESVVMYVSQGGVPYNVSRTETDYLGNYSFTWNYTSAGTYYIRTSWSGASNYAGADSETLTVFVGFYERLVQFEGPGYNYILDFNPIAAAYTIRDAQGVREFLDIHLPGAGISFAGEFIILRSEQTITAPTGTQRIRLPDNLTMNDQFGFILRNDGGDNYSANVRGLDDYDISQITLDGDGTLTNASAVIRENTWYKVVAQMSEDEVTAELSDVNGTILENTASRDDAMSINEFGILMTNNTDKVIVFKNLKVKTLNHTVQPLKVKENSVDEYELLSPYIDLTILLGAALAAVIYVKKRKKLQRPALKETAPVTKVLNIALASRSALALY